MKLYDHTMAPSPRRVRIFLAEKGVKVPLIPVDLFGGENLTPEYLRISPRGLCPLLELDDGTRIDEVSAICRYFEERYPEPPLMGTDAVSKAVTESWQRRMEIDGFISVAEIFRNSAPGFEQRGLPGIAEPIPAIPALIERGKAGLRRYYQQMNQRLAASEFVAGPTFTIADITALCVIDFAGFVNLNIPEGDTYTQRWYKAIAARPSASA